MRKTEDQKIVSFYLGRIAKANLPNYQLSGVFDWIEKNEMDIFGKPLQNMLSNPEPETRQNKIQRILTRANRPNSTPLITRGDLMRLFPEVPRPSGNFTKRIDFIERIFKLNEVESEFIALVVLSNLSGFLESFLSDAFGRISFFAKKNLPAISAMLNMSVARAEMIFDTGNNLFTKGLCEVSRYGDDVGPSHKIIKIIHTNATSIDDFRSIILEERGKAKLSKSDFPHLSNEIDYIEKLLGSALSQKEKGINILLYGQPGTGKTEIAKTISKDIGANIYLLSENKKDESRNDRISELCMAKAILENEPNNIILMDEIEDIFYKEKWQHSKIFFNRLLEKNDTPIIWISNDIRAIYPAFIRRFSYALEVKVPPHGTREKIWKNLAAKNKVKLATAELKDLGQKYKVAPAFAETALRSARLVKDNSAIERTLKSLETATGICTGKRIREHHNLETNFNTELLNTDTDLRVLTDKIIKGQIRKFSMCLFGAPGTGKSAYACYLAKTMGLEVIHKRASDLISPYVGQSEQNIAAAFAEAKNAEAVLVIDEADTFLHDRNQAQRSWEVSLVNEMLTQMESHNHPFICTTNLMDKLDAASLRRFTFKVKYTFLTKEQVKIALKTFFDLSDALEIDDLSALTPGDFAVVKNRAEILAIKDADEIIRMLKQEQNAKKLPPRHIGFGR